jgi:streptogramin lyase
MLGVALLGRDGATRVVVPDSLVKIDPATNEIVDAVSVGKNPGPPVIVGRYVFVASEDDGALYRVEMRSGEVATSGRYDASGLGLAAESDSKVWVVSAGRASAGRASVVRVDAGSLESFDRIRLPRYSEPFAVTVGGGSLWVSEGAPPGVSRWSLRTLRLERRYRLYADSAPLAIGFGEGAAWVADPARNRLLRIDARSGRMTRIPVGDAPVSPVVAFGSVWLQMFYGRNVWRIDPHTGKPRAIIPVPETPQGIAAGAGALWVGGHCGGVVSRIDPDSDSVVATIKTGYYPRVPAVGGGFVWIGVAAEPSAPC